MVGVALAIQVITVLYRRDLSAEAREMGQEEQSEHGELLVKHFKVSNPNCFGRTLIDLSTRQFGATISRVTRAGKILSAAPGLRLEQGDIVTVVSSISGLSIMQVLFGEECASPMELGLDVLAVDVEISHPELSETPLSEMSFYEKYKVVITRVRRQGIEFVPNRGTSLEIGDYVRIVGEREAVEAFRGIAGSQQHRMIETSMLPFLTGILLGIIVGSLPIYLTGNFKLKLGLAGGCFLTSLLLGHFGKIGPFRMHVPPAARNLSRELGLLIFLAGAGTSAGTHFLSVFHSNGWSLVIAGISISMISMLTSLLLAHFALGRNFLESYGLTCGAMNNSLPLSFAREKSASDYAALAYASVYPISLILKIVMAQLLLRLFGMLG
jgi:putative transport protein